MTQPKPAPLTAAEYLTLKATREAARASAASLVPVEGGEPIPAEEPAHEPRGKTF